jgi:chemotaxis family two-component system sensor kinase Cph1
MQSADTTDRALPDLSLCDQEPIHIPGCIQPRGVLLALAGETLRVLQVSQSCASLLGLSPEALLGRELHALLGADLERAVRAAHARWLRSRKQPASFDWRRPQTGEAFSAYLHASGDTLVLELEAYPESYAEPDRDLYPQQTAHQWRQDEGWLDDALQRFAEVRAEPELEAKLAASATLFRDLTGYDRVMIYRFDAEWHGEVVAEARRADMEPYLGLHYPATDIPVQARRLYTLCPTRIIVDVFDQPSPLTPLYDPKTGAPLDLSLSILRSVSPVHLEYLSNMGVRATLTASLRQGAELWGLIACHHLTPRSIPRRLRELVGWLAEDLAVQIALAEAVAARSYSEQLKAFRAQVMTAMRARGRLAELLSGPHLPSLLGAVGADGVALIQGGEVFTGGVAPDPARILDIADALAAEAQSTPADLFVTDCLSEHSAWDSRSRRYRGGPADAPAGQRTDGSSCFGFAPSNCVRSPGAATRTRPL